MLSVAESTAVWKSFLHGVVKRYSPLEIRTGYLPRSMTEELRVAIIAAPQVSLSEGAGLMTDLNLEDGAELERSFTYKRLDGWTRWALYPVLKHISKAVSEGLGSPWAIHNVRSYISKSRGELGPHKWHTDGMPKEMLKIMIYFGEGGLELEGGPDIGGYGAWVLFYNSVVRHRAKASAGRIATEITISPWPVLDLEPRFLGANSRHPVSPEMYA